MQKMLISKIEEIKLKRFAKKLICHYEDTIREISRKKQIMNISQMKWRYDFFNIAFLNNTLSLILYSFYKGCIPIISINEGTEYMQWDWYFKQPLEVILGSNEAGGVRVDISDFTIVECDKKDSDYHPTFNLAFECSGIDYEIWSFLYRKFVCFNQKTEEYILNDSECLGSENDAIGILLRGTDYAKMKPKHHPIQPDAEEVLSLAQRLMTEKHLHKAYVATEEERLANLAADILGKEKVLANRRMYYDHLYNGGAIGEVHFDRENDNFWKGLEYLSSLVILTRCKGIVAENCGGTLFTLLYNNAFEFQYIFNKGVYK